MREIPAMIEKIQKTPLHEIVVKQIVESISLGIYRKGDRLPSENNLCALYGVSRITMRKALKQLVTLGFIETRQGQGSTVIVSSDDPRISARSASSGRDIRYDFQQVMQARLLLEPALAAMLTQTASEAVLQGLKGKFRGEATGGEDSSPALPEAFHLAIAEAFGNPLIYDFLAQLPAPENAAPSNLTSSGKRIEWQEEACHQHQKILNAILSRQPDMAYLYMKEHLLCLGGFSQKSD